MKKLVLGIGNPIIGDDGVGFHVIEALQSVASPGSVVTLASDASGLGILDLIVDYDEVIIVDAIQTKGGKPGEVCRLKLESFSVSKHATSPHDVDLPTAIEIGRLAGLKIPQKISIVAIEIPETLNFSTRLSPVVASSIPAAVSMVRQILQE